MRLLFFILLWISLAVLVTWLNAWLVMTGFNLVISPVLHLPQITMFQAFVLSTVFSVLFGSKTVSSK